MCALPLWRPRAAGRASGLLTRRPAGVTQTATFSVRVDLVQVDVIPADAQGRFVENLTRDDFEVLDDGKPQAVAAFEYINIPVLRRRLPSRQRAPRPRSMERRHA